MKFFKYVALAVLASTISAKAVSTETVGNLKRTDTVVTAVDDLISDTELETALNSYATKAWAATTATNAANHAAGSKVAKVTGAQSGHVVKFASGGEVADSGLAVDDLLTSADLSNYTTKSDFTVTTNTANKTITVNLAGKSATALYGHQDITGKADKVANATTGDFAGLDANGNLTDSGKKSSDFAAASHTHAQSDVTGLVDALAGKLNRPIDTNNGCIPVWTSEGQLQDSGKAPTDFATSAQGAKADSAYQKPSTGIPSTDLAQAVRTSLGKADNSVQKQTLTALGANDTIDTLYKRVNQIIQVLNNETFTP